MNEQQGFNSIKAEQQERILRALKQAYEAIGRNFPDDESEKIKACEEVLGEVFSGSFKELGVDENGNKKASRLNIYTNGLGKHLVTLDVNEGITPFMTHDKSTNTLLKSLCYIVPQDIEHTHEWYKPSVAEAKTLDKNLKEHVLKGGLLLREVGHVFKPKFKDRIASGIRLENLSKN